MGKYKAPTNSKSKYYIPKEDYLTAVHYSLRYPLWKEEVDDLANTARGISYDKDRVQTSSDYDSTMEAAIKIQEKQHKIQLIDDTIHSVAQGMDRWLRLGVCYGLTFDQLKSKKMPCERDMYYLMRRHYYYELSKRI